MAPTPPGTEVGRRPAGGAEPWGTEGLTTRLGCHTCVTRLGCHRSLTACSAFLLVSGSPFPGTYRPRRLRTCRRNLWKNTLEAAGAGVPRGPRAAGQGSRAVRLSSDASQVTALARGRAWYRGSDIFRRLRNMTLQRNSLSPSPSLSHTHTGSISIAHPASCVFNIMRMTLFPAINRFF